VETARLSPIRHDRVCLEPSIVIKCHLARGLHEVLVHWKGTTATEAQWVNLIEFCDLYPSFQLKDKLILQAGRDVKVGITYQRRQKKEGKDEVPEENWQDDE
jgi:hypothetical protein